MKHNKQLKSKISQLPSVPGVYIYKDADGEILYIGKAKKLKARVRSYFSSTTQHSVKTQELVRRIHDMETIVVGSELEALLLEANLIKLHKPPFNIRLKEGHTYPYIKVTLQEPFPRLLVTYDLERDGARYFGPFTERFKLRKVVDALRLIFPIRSCSYALPKESPSRPCLDYHIKRCNAPCVGFESQEEYGEMMAQVLDVLEGKTKAVRSRMEAEMTSAAKMLDFERAAKIRDALAALAQFSQHQRTVDVRGGNRDLVGFARDGSNGCIVRMRIRDGKLVGRDAETFETLDEENSLEEALEAGMRSLYLPLSEYSDIGPEVLLPSHFESLPLFEELLSAHEDRKINLHIPERGEKVRLVSLANENARHVLEEERTTKGTAEERAENILYELQSELDLKLVPRVLVCFDISHTSGSETVGSAVVFENALPSKKDYRKFKVKGKWGNDDYRSMEEVVERFFRLRIREEAPLPELVVIDGGKGQLAAAEKALSKIDLPPVEVCALAKQEEEVFRPGRPEPIVLSKTSPALRLLQRARDEAHRFAVTYNRNLRSKRTLKSELTQIPGIGKKRTQHLLQYFGSVKDLKAATEADIARVPGFSVKLAGQIKEALEQKETST